ncbi:MAG: hypothetical protein E6Q51_04290 [Methylophilus methylotrophus]|uniref:Uncharacterized protein n=1 Tax=Methylophilus methylotrophus TaxID=17 RepID=A0A5C7WK34_METME|nr:MAG: hypothetical protein E6Q51_04290 [Methylophilus methylotrophus]
MNLSNEPQGRPEKIIAVFIALLGLSVPFFMDSVAHSALIDPFRLLGEYLVYLLVATLLALGISRGLKPQIRAWIMLGMSVLFLLFTLRQAHVNSVSINKAKQSATELFTLMEGTNKQILGNSSTADNQEIKQVNESPSTINQVGHSEAEDFAILMEALKPIATKFAHDGLELNNKIMNSGIEKVLEPGNLTSASGIQAGRQTIQNLRPLINSRNELLANYYQEVTSKVSEQNFTQGFKQSFEKSFFKNKPMLEHNYSELTRIGNLSLNNLEKILDLVEDHLGIITIDNGQLLFPDQTSLNQYNQYLTEVIRLSEQEEQISKMLMQKSAEHMESVKENLKKL